MKSKKWLITILLIVFIINLIFYLVIHFTKIDELVKQTAIDEIEKMLQADAEINDLTLNDRHIKISGIKIKNQTLDLAIDQIYIEYNLIQLLFSRFQNFRAIKKIKIHDPLIDLIIQSSKNPKKEKVNFELPQFSEYFGELNIYNGKLSVQYQNGDFFAATVLDNINISIHNKKHTNISGDSRIDKKGKLQFSATIEDSELKKAQATISAFQPQQLRIPFLKNMHPIFDVSLKYDKKEIAYQGNIKNINTQLAEFPIEADSLVIFGNEQKLNVQTENLRFAQQELKLRSALIDPFSKDKKLAGNIIIPDLDIQRFQELAKGNVNAKLTLSGKLDDPKLTGIIISQKIEIAQQKLEDIKMQLDYFNKNIAIDLEQSFWQGNKIRGLGNYDLEKGLVFELKKNRLVYRQNDLLLTGYLDADIHYSSEIKAQIDLSEIHLEHKDLVLYNYNFSGKYDQKSFAARLSSPFQHLVFSADGELSDLTGKIKFQRFDLKNIFNDNFKYPSLSGYVDLSLNSDSLKMNSFIRTYGEQFGELDGILRTDIFLDRKSENVQVSFKTEDARFNYEPLSIDLAAEGSLDSIETKKFLLNKKIDLAGKVIFQPKLSYSIDLKTKELEITSLLRYFMNYYAYKDIDGKIDLDLHYDNFQEGKTTGKIAIRKFHNASLSQLNLLAEIKGNKNSINIPTCSISRKNNQLLDLQGKIELSENFSIDLNGELKNVYLDSIFVADNFSGQIFGNIHYTKNSQMNELGLQLNGEKIRMNKFLIDSLLVDIKQKEKLLLLNKFHLTYPDLFTVEAFGKLGYNFLNGNLYPDSNRVILKCKGDPLKIVQDQFKLITAGNSQCQFDLELGIAEEGLSFHKMNFILENGKLQLKGQPHPIHSIFAEFQIQNNKFQIKNFRGTIGEGRIYLDNELNNDGNDFILGSLNLGIFKLRTNQQGILISVPEYSPENSMLNVRLNGREKEEMEIIGPFENTTVIGDIHFSNGNIIYPPHTENLLKLFDVVTEKQKKKQKQKKEENPSLPISLDIILHFDENLRYVTYPANIKLDRNCYLQIDYQKGDFKIPNALFNASEGSVNMFGTQLELDNLQIIINRYEGVRISGSFYKKISDGTMITLDVYNDIQNDDGLRFDLLSDNPNDKITDILAKLRYNRSMDEISPGQRKTMMQDEFIQIAGLSLESAIFMPLISPIDNFIRQVTKLDHFHLKTGFVQNIFTSFSDQIENETLFEADKQNVEKFTSDLFLNNLSITAGKYLTDQLFFDYQVRFEKPLDLVIESKLGVFHEFALRYDLPYKFIISYHYNILPFERKNSHEIMLEKAIQFW